MGTVSPTQVSDGTTADASDINTPVNQIAAEFNGNIDNSNIKSSAAISGSKLASNSITDTQMSTEVKPVTRFTDDFFDHVASGCVWSGDSYGSTRAASMTAGVVYVSGIRATVAAVTARTFTASKDTYIDVDSTGAITYTEVANNAASPALSAGNVRIGIIVTGGTSIATANSVNQGQENRVLPIASSIPYAVTDSLGNLICPRDPNRKILGYKQVTANQAVSSGAYVDLTGLNCPVIVPTGRKVKITVSTPNSYSTTTSAGGSINIYDSTGSVQLSESGCWTSTAGGVSNNSCIALHTPSTTSRTYKAQAHYSNATTWYTNCNSAAPGFIMVELV